jgi:hypothetical protein
MKEKASGVYCEVPLGTFGDGVGHCSDLTQSSAGKQLQWLTSSWFKPLLDFILCQHVQRPSLELVCTSNYE